MYKNKNKFFFLLLIIITLISYIFSKEIKIYEGDTFEQDLKNFIETKTKLFLIFFAKNCEYCSYSVRVLKELVVPHYENDDKISFGVINLDRKSNYWIGLKFNITHIPYILLIEDKKMYLFKDQFEERHVIDFINEEKNIEDAIDIPEDIGLYKKINFYMADIIQKTSDIFIKWGLSKFWSYTLSFILLILIFIYLVYLEHKLLNSVRQLISYCSKSKKKKDNNIDDNKDNIEENKEDKNKTKID